MLFIRWTSIAVIVMALIFGMKLVTEKKVSEEASLDYEEYSPKSYVTRKPAAITKNHPPHLTPEIPPLKSEIFERSKDNQAFQHYDQGEIATKSSPGSFEGIGGGPTNFPSVSTRYFPTQSQKGGNPKNVNPHQGNSSVTPSMGPFWTPMNQFAPTSAPTDPSLVNSPKETSRSPSPSIPSPVIPVPETITCGTNIGGGTFNAPIQLAINCSASGGIKICIAEGTCCDPSTGTNYTGPITLGLEEKNYCVSFMSQTSRGVSEISQQSYTFNAKVPHLEVSLQKVFYQTTELQGMKSIASEDFGRDGFEMGMINLKSTDPGISGENLTCREIVEESSSMNPLPFHIVHPILVDSHSSHSQLDITLGLPELFYGKNFITTYMRNIHFLDPIYTCTTNEIILEDFPYFQMDISHGVDGTNSVREFAGGFGVYGFYESADQVSRGPAGIGQESVAQVQLESGLFSIFY